MRLSSSVRSSTETGIGEGAVATSRLDGATIGVGASLEGGAVGAVPSGAVRCRRIGGLRQRFAAPPPKGDSPWRIAEVTIESRDDVSHWGCGGSTGDLRRASEEDPAERVRGGDSPRRLASTVSEARAGTSSSGKRGASGSGKTSGPPPIHDPVGVGAACTRRWTGRLIGG